MSEKWSRHNGGTISKKLIWGRKDWMCSNCRKTIPVGVPHVRLFGSSGNGEKPYVLRECMACRRARGEVWNLYPEPVAAS